jgi:SMI1 / KNR4 family (SUKH-1)
MINLPRNITSRPPASNAALDLAARAVGGRLPESLRALLATSDGFEAASGVVLYGSAELEERQHAYEIQQYSPHQVAIGDDGQGRVILLERESDAFS